MNLMAFIAQDSKFDTWPSEIVHATSRSRGSSQKMNRYEWTGNKHCFKSGGRTRELRRDRRSV